MFHIKFINNKKVIYSDLLAGVEHFFTTRETVIKSESESMKSLIAQNKHDILEYLNLPEEYFLSPVQTHSGNIRIANPTISSYPNTDAMIIDNTKLGIYLNFADCTPIILYDKKHNIGAVVHAGWRGTAKCILTNTVKKMMENYLSEISNIYVAIGPAIGQCCYCVGEDVYNKLKNTVSDISKNSHKIYDKYYVDLKNINKQQLTDMGFKPEQIDVCNYCTACNNDLFFSYRKEKTTSRHSAVLKLNK